MKYKFPSDSITHMSELILPNDTNYQGNLIGGKLMYWMDLCAAMTASKHCNNSCVTLSVDNLVFQNPIKLGNIVHLQSKVTRVFNTSMEIYVKVNGEDLKENSKYDSHEAFLTFVSIDKNGKPIPIPQIMPQTNEEKKMFEDALKRRELRFLLAGKIKPEEAISIKTLFYK